MAYESCYYYWITSKNKICNYSSFINFFRHSLELVAVKLEKKSNELSEVLSL